MAYLWWKAVHIIGVVSWFAGLFYLVRLFIYHAEAREEPEAARRVLVRQYSLMEWRLYYMITTPAMAITVASAIALLVLQPGWLSTRWMWVKLAVVGFLLVYHYWCQVTLARFAKDDIRWTGQQLRWANEVPTLLLILGVSLAVLKELTPLGTLALTIVGISVLFGVSIRLYARLRQDRPGSAPAGEGPGRR